MKKAGAIKKQENAVTSQSLLLLGQINQAWSRVQNVSCRGLNKQRLQICSGKHPENKQCDSVDGKTILKQTLDEPVLKILFEWTGSGFDTFQTV
jgi:hypothetical protein